MGGKGRRQSHVGPRGRTGRAPPATLPVDASAAAVGGALAAGATAAAAATVAAAAAAVSAAAVAAAAAAAVMGAAVCAAAAAISGRPRCYLLAPAPPASTSGTGRSPVRRQFRRGHHPRNVVFVVCVCGGGGWAAGGWVGGSPCVPVLDYRHTRSLSHAGRPKPGAAAAPRNLFARWLPPPPPPIFNRCRRSRYSIAAAASVAAVAHLRCVHPLPASTASSPDAAAVVVAADDGCGRLLRPCAGCCTWAPLLAADRGRWTVGHWAATVRVVEQSNLMRQGVGLGVGVRVGARVGATTTGLWTTTNVRSDGATDAAATDDATAAVAVTAATATMSERRAPMMMVGRRGGGHGWGGVRDEGGRQNAGGWKGECSRGSKKARMRGWSGLLVRSRTRPLQPTAAAS
ncbi:hypothetical protein I4F81_012492 [Pyropia yezoensis]|uniref:Uncharacterized protein n=1 Tax=Pyropia yezoensis TaxID=2788 RepID=A0ACC3CIN5_PYRYE|nr:hypothetical protein I4F81_012492 [Neopyropia yezoensis]